MQPLSPRDVSLRSTALALAIGSIALLILGLQPILLGQLFAAQVVTIQGIGLIAMGEIVALGLGVVLADAFLPLSRAWRIAALASLTIMVLDGITCLIDGDLPMAAVRTMAGLPEGILVWLTTSIIVRSHNPDRLAAVFMVAQTLSQAIVAALFTGVVVPMAGWQGGFAVLAALSLLPCMLARSLPQRLRPLHSQSSAGMRWSFTSLLPLTLAFLQMASIGSLWAYLEPLGLAYGLHDQDVGGVVSLVLMMQVCGGIVAIFTVRRLNTRLILALGTVALGGIALTLLQLDKPSLALFSMLLAAFGFTWLFIMPFHIVLAFIVDPSGRVAVLVPAAQLLGSAFGPLIVSLAVQDDNALLVPVFSAGFAMLALVLKTLGHIPLSRQAALLENTP
ncbi:hypothetical protein KQ940_10455 [Marinobacterium sp. D7]|uniref:hypothetical protein n=1 Tax=Marinobacterium ramblicola TaxID=2849041 RepID=UPI001C2CD1C8|nr:hypothetical protein [Marinobacterium ramblicola]MBV1788478.1 hypothetical protein [Marinobacterium ramblicola]